MENSWSSDSNGGCVMRNVLLFLLLFPVLVFGQNNATQSPVNVLRHQTRTSVETDHIAMLRTVVVPNNNTPFGFNYDANETVPFGPVPEGFSFVITGVNIIPEGIPISASDQYLVVVTVGGSRFLTSRFIGASQTYHLTTGLVIPAQQNVDVRNTTFSSNPIVVELFGYFAKGSGLPIATPFSPED